MECILSEEIEGVFSLTATVCIVIVIKGQSIHFCPSFFFLFLWYILKLSSYTIRQALFLILLSYHFSTRFKVISLVNCVVKLWTFNLCVMSLKILLSANLQSSSLCSDLMKYTVINPWQCNSNLLSILSLNNLSFMLKNILWKYAGEGLINHYFCELFNRILFQTGKHKTSLPKDIAPAIQRKLLTCKDAATEESSSTER